MEFTGVLQAKAVVEVENIPYLQTEKGTLVFTIASNGHIFGHRLEDGGDNNKRDVELEVFAPGSWGYTLRRRGGHSGARNIPVNELSENQEKVIHRIMAQRDILSGMLGVKILLFNTTTSILASKYTQTKGLLRKLDDDRNTEYVGLADCSKTDYAYTGTGLFVVKYSDEKYRFQVSGAPEVGATHVSLFRPEDETVFGFTHGDMHKLSDLYQKGFRFFVNRSEASHWRYAVSAEQFASSEAPYPHYVIHAAQAEKKKFFVGNFPACHERHLFPNEISVLLDTENIFNCYGVDDALLFLEEKRLSPEESKLYWTLAIAENKLMKEQRRIRSNNSGA
ncbi:hypothetical protein HYT01_00870 [Candidatus Giovannonibacteria bacterium]|nr:hypothetical protein [Candidatus Giovannonibacteria bacterium]